MMMRSLTLLLLAAVFIVGTDGFSRPSFHTVNRIPFPSLGSRNTVISLAASTDNEEGSTTSISDRASTAQSEAQEALTAVGWSLPAQGDLTSDDPFVQAIDASIQRDIGVSLEELLNPAKVVNLERDLYVSRLQLAELTGQTTPTSATTLTTADCDGGGGGDEAESLRKVIQKKEADLLVERRSVFRGWLKNVFLVQAVLSFALSFVMATQPATLFGSFSWYNNPQYNMDISISVLGYWWWWLFVIPSLRSRRPKGNEKQALDIAFLASPLVSLIAPVATKDTGLIWWANFLVVAGAYGYAFLLSVDEDSDDDASQQQQPEWLKFVYKSLDFGSGRERGARN
jgi:hypothetical protein